MGDGIEGTQGSALEHVASPVTERTSNGVRAVGSRVVYVRAEAVSSPRTTQPPDPAWQCVDPATLAGASASTLDRFFLELFRRVAGGDLRASHPVSGLELPRGESLVTSRYGTATVGMLRTQHVVVEGGQERLTMTWEIRGLPGIEVRGKLEPDRDGKPGQAMVPLELRDERTGALVAAAWRQAFGAEPHLVPLPGRARVKTKGPPFRCGRCRDVLASEPEDTRTCPRCLAPLDPARAIVNGEWGPLRAELSAPGLHRLFSSFNRSVDTDAGVDIVFDAIPEGAGVPPCAGLAIGPMGATRTLLIRPDGTFAVAREQLIEGREPGMYPRERVLAVDWTPHPALGKGLDERNRIRAAADEKGMRGWLGEHLLFELPPADDDADGKCVCLVAACGAQGAKVRFERYAVSEGAAAAG
jgi:hypothetical protein